MNSRMNNGGPDLNRAAGWGGRGQFRAPGSTARRRFAACAAGAGLLSISVRAARRWPASKSISTVHLSAGGFLPNGGTPGLPDKINLTRCEIFRGKIPRRNTQNQNIPSKSSLPLRQTYE
jgi:hypothetical protein